MAEKIKFKFLKDVPLGNKDGVAEFYHSKVAPALQEILENETCVHTIGLFSKWGTGKSTIIEMIKDKLKYPMFVFDAWKYQEDSLRRIFLLEFINFISVQEQQNKLKVKKEEFKRVKDKIKSVLYKTTETKTVEPKKNKNSKWWREKFFENKNLLFLFLFLILVPVLVFFVEKRFNINQIDAIKNVVNYFVSLSLLTLILFKIYFSFLVSFFKDLTDKIIKSIFPIATIRETIEREERLNSPEQFENLFKEIIGSIEGDKKIIIVFDNIDRVQGDTAIKILSTIKTFLDPKDIASLTFVVPCDSDAINNQIKSFYKDEDDESDSSEYLRKLFNVIIWMPEFIEADLHAFIKKIIEDTGEIKELLQQEDVLFVIRSAFSNNPREIKQFINNLISALVLASKTDVWEIIKNNVSYLAKVLILEQKYPKAYQRLKDKWFEPENILQQKDEKDEKGLRGFMLDTSRITVDNAEPFIYFKEPSISKKLADSLGLTVALFESNNEKAKEIIQEEKDKEAVVDFVELLLRKYRGQKELLKNIFVTHLEVFDELKITTSKKPYYETLARTLDVDLWQFFTNLPTNLIFTNLLTKKELGSQLRKLLIKRYVLALDSEEMRKPNKLEFVKNIITNLKQNANLVDTDDRLQISNSIDEHFSTNLEIISLFKKSKEQEYFITPQAFEKFVTNINNQTFLKDTKTIFQFKEFILKKNKLGIVLQKITELIQKETSEYPDYRPEKQTFMKSIGEIFSEFKNELKNIEDGIKIELIKQFIQAFNSIGSWDNRTLFINNLRWLYFSAPDSQKTELNNLINTYFQQVTASSKIEEVLDYWKKETLERFINDFFPSLLQKSMQDDTFLDVIYKRADKSKKVELITNLINQKGINSLNFIKKLGDSLPDRQMVVRSLLSKLPSIPFGQQVLIYDYLPSQLSKNDPTDLKDQIVNQIKTLLKSDTPASQEAGLNLFTDTALSEEKRREIGKEVLDWLRQPGKALNSNHRFVLKSVVSLVPIMQKTPVSDFIYTIFDMLKQDRDKPTLEVSLEILDEIKPKYTKHEKDFKDLLDRLKVWPQNENKTLVIERIKNLKSNSPRKNEKAFWKEVDSLIKESE